MTRVPPKLATVAAIMTALSLAWSGSAVAGGGPENVFLVVNARGDRSKEVANHYIALRHIPAVNVFYVNSPPNAARMMGVDFRDKILRPTLAELDRRGIRGHIDQIVYSCDFPFFIDCSTLVNLPNVQGTKRPVASLTGATYLYQFIEAAEKSLVELNTNFYFAPTVDGATATRAFRGSQAWGPGGIPVTTGGLKYLMATQLGCSQPEGNTVPEIIAYLKRACAADGTRPEGTFFYMKNDDRRSKARDDKFPAAVNELRALGLSAEVGIGVVPSGQRGINGLTTGAIYVRLQDSGSRLIPGALVDNLTSAGGVLQRVANPKPQTRISEYLRQGAAGASGTVIEPFAIGPKFPAPSLHVHYARGATMAEAFYQAVQGPYQLLIMGDPLCQPWAYIPKVTVTGVTDGGIATGAVEIVPTAEMAAGHKVQRYELYVDGRPRGTRVAGQKFALDTTALGDGYHELRVIAVDDTPVEMQGSWIGNVIVKNGHDAVALTAPGGPRVSGTMLSVSVASTIDGVTAVMHNGRELGRVTGRQGTVQIAAESLGKGPVVITARTVGEPGLRSRPLALEGL